MKTKKNNPKQGNVVEEEVKIWSDEQLYKALVYVEDLMDKAMMPMLLWGETAHSVFNDELFGDRIQIATYQDSFNYLSESIIQDNAKIEIKDMDNAGTCKSILRTEFEGVPIEILSVGRKDKYVNNPDTIRFRYASYLIPNPIKDYLRELVESF